MSRKERFVRLCEFFLNGFNPRMRNHVIILDCILGVPDYLFDRFDGPSYRHLAYNFVHWCVKFGNKEGNDDSVSSYPQNEESKLLEWTREWWKENG